MNKLYSFASLIRLSNLFIILLAQWVSSCCFLRKYSVPLFFLIGFATISIAASGYILNDIIDIEIDIINNKKKMVSKKNKKIALNLTIIFSLIGLFLAYLASIYSNKYLFFFFPLALLSLICYAFFLSTYKWLGNILISLLVGLSISISFMFQSHIYPPLHSTAYIYFGLYILLAVLLNWIREITKDIEDMKGDLTFKRQSLPILLGVKFSKTLILLVTFFLLICFVISFTFFKQNFKILLPFTPLGILLLVIIIQCLNSKTSKNYKMLSGTLKATMLYGTLIPLILKSF